MQLSTTISWQNTRLLPALVSDYLANNDTLRHLYEHVPTLDSLKSAMLARANFATDRAMLVAELNTQYSRLEIAPSVKRNIEVLAEANTFTVTAAHQPALFLGSLFTLYKIAGTINLCRQLKAKYPEANFVPVFWMGSEDHDMDELGNTMVNGTPLAWTAEARGPVGRLAATILQTPLEELKKISANTAVLDLLEKTVAQSATVGEFTQSLLNSLFGVHGLVVVNQDNRAFKQRFAAVMLEDIFEQRAAKILPSTVRFLEQNYKAQVQPRDINIFYLTIGSRERIYWDEATLSYRVNKLDKQWTAEQLRKEMAECPENFSPNVVYRPLLQEMILPNIAFVGGAGELSYWLEYKELFAHFGVPMPMLMMRNGAVLLPKSAVQKMEKLKLSVTDFFEPLEGLITRYVKLNTTADTSLAAEQSAISAIYTALASKAEAIDSTLKSSVGAEQQKVIAALVNLEAKLLKAEKRKQETAVNQIRNLHTVIFSRRHATRTRGQFCAILFSVIYCSIGRYAQSF
jgi:bacillithiol biosynthesis cysteine-adding enzyme BshC